MADTFLNGARTAELWAAIKTALAGKADLNDLKNYTTPDAVATAITSALAGYATDAGVRTAIAAALADYMTAGEVNDAIASAVVKASGIRFEPVDELPESGETNAIYLTPNGKTGSNVKDEYMWIDGRWEVLGSTTVDLEGYWSKEELSIMTADELKAILV